MIGLVLVALTGDSAGEIEHVKFYRRMTQQMGEITESLGVFQTEAVSPVADGPILALFAEYAFFCSRGTHDGPRVGDDSRSGSGAAYLLWHVDSFQVREKI